MSDNKQQQIRAALDTRLFTLPGNWPTIFEGEDYSPVVDVAYQMAYLLPRRTQNPTLTERLRDDGGVYQISLYFPRGADTGTCDLRAGQIVAHFPAGLMLNSGIIMVRIEGTPAIGAGMPSGDRWLVPVSIRYRCLT